MMQDAEFKEDHNTQLLDYRALKKKIDSLREKLAHG